MKRLLLALCSVILVGLVYLGLFGVQQIEARINTVASEPPYPASPRAERLHASALVADLHADTLLWSRNLLQRAEQGHVDVPRLIEGNVALQVFAAATKAPWGLNPRRNSGDSDMFTLLAITQRWPVRTWSSLTERALYQASKLRRAAADSGGKLVLIRSARELERYLKARQTTPESVGAVLAIEGLHALEGDLAALDTLFDAGFRMMGLTHFFDNEIGGSAHGVEKGAATEFGRRVMRRMEELGIALDLAHASPALIEEVLDLTTRPVLVSHTGVQATCPGPRNLSDAHVRGIAETGGVIGIGFFEWAVCEIEPASIVRAIRHIADLVGVDHVGLGSDFDGGTHTPFDVTGLAQITEALLADGFSEHEVRKILGGNEIRVLGQLLPPQ